MIKWNAISFIIFIRVFSKPLYHLSFLSLSLLSWRKKRFIIYHFYHDKNDKSDKNDKIFFLSFLFWAFVLSVLLSSVKGRGNDWIALFWSSNLNYTQLMYFNQTYMVCRVFAELLQSRKFFEKSSHGRKLSEKSHEKVNALQAKKFWILKTRLISQSGNYLKPLELRFSKKALG